MEQNLNQVVNYVRMHQFYIKPV